MAKLKIESIICVIIVLFVNGSFSENVPKKLLCDICECSETQVICSGLDDLDMLLTYNGSDVLRLTITDSHLGLLRKEVFERFKNIPSVFISSNYLSVDSSSLSLLTGVMNLTMANNSIDAIPSGLFDSNTKLIHLNLTGNQITYLDNDGFDKLQHLTKLHLANNLVSRMHVDAFSGLSALEELDLSGNRLERVEAAALAPLERLRVLRLQRNRVASLDGAALEALSRPGLSASLEGNALRCACGELRDAWEATGAAARGLASRLRLACASGQSFDGAMRKLSCAGSALRSRESPPTIGDVLRRAREEGEDERLSPAEVVALAEGVVLAEALEPPAAAVWRATLDAEASLHQREIVAASTPQNTAWPVFLLCIVLTSIVCVVGMTIYYRVQRKNKEDVESPYTPVDRASTSSSESQITTYTFRRD